VFDPGGADDLSKLSSILGLGVYLLKPNEHEAEAIAGVYVHDMASAKNAAEKLMELGAQNVMITAGSKGAYLFSDATGQHIPAPRLGLSGDTDETGCGDQALAAICAGLAQGQSLADAAATGVLAGSLQYHKQGIQPISLHELVG
jgi:ribokinase